MRYVRRYVITVVVCCVILGTQLTPDNPSVNQPPVVSNVRAVVDAQNSQVILTYDVADAEQDSLHVALTISVDRGETFLFPVDSVSGDVGFPVFSGTDRQVIWHYDPELITLSANPDGFLAQVIADDRYEIPIEDLVDKVDSARIKIDLQRFERVRHYDAGFEAIEATKDYLDSVFVANGLQASRQPFTFSGWNAENIIGRLPGFTDEAAVYIIDAHFDTVSQTPGVDDNASGTVGMLEAMRVLSQFRFQKSIKFIGFDLEEVGLRGSERYVQEGIPSFEHTEGVINFEMIGYTCLQAGCDAFLSIGNYINNVYDANSQALSQVFASSGQTYVPQLRIISTQAVASNPNFRRSDHARFWDAGIPALFLNDGANFRNPHYHQPTDRLDTIDLAFITHIVKTTVATIARLAGLHHSGASLSPVFQIAVSTPRASEADTPEAFSLAQNYPNPFRPPTAIRYTLVAPGVVTLKIYNVIGQEIKTLVQARQAAGAHTVTWNGLGLRSQRLASGVYIYRLYVDDQVQSRKMVLLE